MTRINLDVSNGEFDFIREAVISKHQLLLSNLDFCKHESNPKPENQPEYWENLDKRLQKSFSGVVASVDKEFDKTFEKFKKQSVIVEKPKKPHWTQTAKGRKIMAARKTRGAKK